MKFFSLDLVFEKKILGRKEARNTKAEHQYSQNWCTFTHIWKYTCNQIYM